MEMAERSQSSLEARVDRRTPSASRPAAVVARDDEQVLGRTNVLAAMCYDSGGWRWWERRVSIHSHHL